MDTSSTTKNEALIVHECIFSNNNQDPDGIRGILATSFPGVKKNDADTDQADGLRERFITSFSSDPQILAFTHYFCINSEESSSDMAAYCTRVLYECLTQDKPEMITVYLWIHQTVKTIYHRHADARTVTNLKMVIQFCSQKSTHSGFELINRSFIALVDNQIHQHWTTFEGNPVNAYKFQKQGFAVMLKRYMEFGIDAFTDLSSHEIGLVAVYLAVNSWPSISQLEEIRKLVTENIVSLQSGAKRRMMFNIRGKFSAIPYTSISKIVDLFADGLE